MLRFNCPTCGIAASAPVECAGRITKCRGCGNPIIVPVPPADQMPPAPAAPEKTSLGLLVSHNPTGMQPNPAVPQTPANPGSKRYAKQPGKPSKSSNFTVVGIQADARPPRKSSGGVSVSTVLLIVLMVFGAGGLFGFGVYYYMEHRRHKDDVANREANDKDAPAPDGESNRANKQPDNYDAPPRRRRVPSLPRNNESPKEPPKKEETPKGGDQAKKDPPRREDVPKQEELTPEERLKACLAGLTSKDQAERLAAIAGLAKLGEKALPAVGPLCELLLSDVSPAVRQAALESLEKIHPELHKSAVVLTVDNNLKKHVQAANEVAGLGERGRGAVPLLLTHLQTMPAQFAKRSGFWWESIDIVDADLHALGEIAPDDPAVQKLMVDLTQKANLPAFVKEAGEQQFFPDGNAARFTNVAVNALEKLLLKHPDQGERIAPLLIAAIPGIPNQRVDPAMKPDQSGAAQPVQSLALELLGLIAEKSPASRPQIVTALIAALKAGDVRAIPLVLKCGAEAKDAVPALKPFKIHSDEKVRAAATLALSKLGDTVVKNNPPKPDGDPKKGNPPKEDPVVRPDPKPADGSVLPENLKPIVARLGKGTADDRAKAADELAQMGEKALPAARALCEAALIPDQKVARAALLALERVHPQIQKPVFVLLVDEAAANHQKALTDISALGSQGKAAIPVLVNEIKRCQELLTQPGARWGQQTLLQVTNQTLQTLAKIGPEDPITVKTVVDLTTFALPPRTRVFDGRRLQRPFLHVGLPLLGELAENQAQHRKLIMPPVVALLKAEVQSANGKDEFTLVDVIKTIEEIGNTLLKCGPEAKPILAAEVVPQLKELQFHKSEAVRNTASALRKKIEDAK